MPKPRSRRQPYDKPYVIFDSFARFEDAFNLKPEDFEWETKSQKRNKRKRKFTTAAKRAYRIQSIKDWLARKQKKWAAEDETRRLKRIAEIFAQAAADREWLAKQK